MKDESPQPPTPSPQPPIPNPQSPIPDPRSPIPDLSIIIVSWNVCALLRDCLQSVFAGRGDLALQVIVVDSFSSDDTVAMVEAEFPQVEVVACTENVGFPRGNNIGLERANGRFLLLLNPDTIVHGDALATMAEYMESNPQAGMVGAQLLNGDGTSQSSRRRFPTLKTAFFESTWLEPYAPQALLHHYYAADLPDGETAVVEWVTGACMFTRREVVAQVGGMDEGYFMYSEEMDWCRRIHEAGWQIVYLPTAQITHLVGKSSEQAVVQRHINFNRAKLRYFRKYHGRFAAACLRLFLLLGYMWQMGVEGIKWVLGHKRPLRAQRIHAYWQVLKSGLKPAGYSS